MKLRRPLKFRRPCPMAKTKDPFEFSDTIWNIVKQLTNKFNKNGLSKTGPSHWQVWPCWEVARQQPWLLEKEALASSWRRASRLHRSLPCCPLNSLSGSAVWPLLQTRGGFAYYSRKGLKQCSRQWRENRMQHHHQSGVHHYHHQSAVASEMDRHNLQSKLSQAKREAQPPSSMYGGHGHSQHSHRCGVRSMLCDQASAAGCNRLFLPHAPAAACSLANVHSNFCCYFWLAVLTLYTHTNTTRLLYN